MKTIIAGTIAFFISLPGSAHNQPVEWQEEEKDGQTRWFVTIRETNTPKTVYFSSEVNSKGKRHAFYYTVAECPGVGIEGNIIMYGNKDGVNVDCLGKTKIIDDKITPMLETAAPLPIRAKLQTCDMSHPAFECYVK